MAYPAKTDRDAILAVAMRQVTDAGVDALSMRSVASTLGLAPNALYRYFADRSALESAITAQSARALQSGMARAVKGKMPADGIRALGKAYLRFARDQRHLYQMVMRPCTACAEDASAQVALWSFVVETVAGVVGNGRARDASTALWAFLHGMTSIGCAPVLGSRQSNSGFEFGLEAWMASALNKEFFPST